MKYKINPRNGDRLSVLGYGCMRFAGDSIVTSFTGRFDEKKVEKLIVSAVEQGINYFDTAYVYTGSEEILGSVLKKHNLRDQVFIATKMPLIMCRKAEDLDKFFDKHLEHLQTDHIDYYLLHMLTDMKTWETLCSWGIREWAEEKKKSGQIRNFGFSFHGAQSEFLALLDAYDWDFCQIQYNYSDENYQAGVTGLKAAAAKGMPVMIMEPLLGGKLAKNLPKKAVERFRQTNSDISPAAWGFRWLYNQPEVTVVLSGMNEQEQLDDNVRIADTAAPGMLTETEQEAIRDVREIFKESYKVHCTGCHYCTPCPAGVDIPACFTAYNTRYSISKSQGLIQYYMGTLMNDKPSYASLCKECGKCEQHCPQSLPIRQNLKAVAKEFEGPLFKGAKAVLPFFVRKKKT
ncbi:MAG: aldo/keto reductase [Lachnospiraceae bacterium]|nr:aldo/keto reductase [Lachnospiraceae bacterium]